MHIPGYIMFLIILGITTVGVLASYQLFRWAMKKIMSATPEEHQLEQLLPEQNLRTTQIDDTDDSNAN